MEITNEIKTKIIAQYLGQRMLSGHYLIGVCFGDNKDERPLLLSENPNSTQVDWEATLEMDMLELKPLSKITDEHAKEMAMLIGGNHLHIIACFRGQPEFKKQPDERMIKMFINQTTVHQFLLSKGYDLPNFLLGGKTLQESGLAIYEEKK